MPAVRASPLFIISHSFASLLQTETQVGLFNIHGDWILTCSVGVAVSFRAGAPLSTLSLLSAHLRRLAIVSRKVSIYPVSSPQANIHPRLRSHLPRGYACPSSYPQSFITPSKGSLTTGKGNRYHFIPILLASSTQFAQIRPCKHRGAP